MTTAKDRLDRLIQENPNIVYETTLTRLGELCGVSRERIRQLLPKAAKKRLAKTKEEKIAKLYKFMEEHPDAMYAYSRYGPGMPNSQIAAALGMKEQTLKVLLAKLGIKRKSKYEGMTSAEIYRWRYHNIPGRKEKQKRATYEYMNRSNYKETHKENFKKATGRYQNKICGTRQCPGCFEYMPFKNSQKNNTYCSRKCYARVARANKELQRYG